MTPIHIVRPTSVTLTKHRLLTAREEIELARRIERGDLKAKEELVLCNMRLAQKRVNRLVGLAGGYLSNTDLLQEAVEGLIRAAEKFDWRRGYRFSTYAGWWIDKSIKQAIENKARPMRLPANVSRRLRSMKTARSELIALSSVEPTLVAIAEFMGLPVALIENDLRLEELARFSSTDQLVGELSDVMLGDLIVGSEDPTQDEVQGSVLRQQLEERIGQLPPLEAKVIQLRHPLDGTEPTPKDIIARELGLKTSTVYSIEKRALKRLQNTGLRAYAQIQKFEEAVAA